MSAAKKYKLHKSPLGSAKAPCAFYSRGECRNGDACKFSHDVSVPVQGKGRKPSISDSSSVVSSESSDSSSDEAPSRPSSSGNANGNVGKATKFSQDEDLQKLLQEKSRILKQFDDAILQRREAEKGKVKASEKPKKGKGKQKRSAQDADSPLAPQQASSKKRKKESMACVAPPSSLHPMFSSTAFPVSSFKTQGEGGGSSNKNTVNSSSSSNNSNNNDDKQQPVKRSKSPAKEEIKKPELPQPANPATSEAKRWNELVKKTRSHKRFNGCMALLSANSSSEDWFHPVSYDNLQSGDPRHESGPIPKTIALDCEMVETTDPLSGRTDSKALARLSVIDGCNPENVLIDTLVKPYWPVTDYRTRINGITEESLKDCQFTLRHAQKFMHDLCTSQTVLIGHAISNDLAALKMVHFRVVDSSFLFSFDAENPDPSNRIPSLKDCVASILGDKMPATHDSVNDSRQSMNLCLSFLNNGGQLKDVVKTSKAPQKNENNTPDKLFVHRIAEGTTSARLIELLKEKTKIEPLSVGMLNFGPVGDGSRGKCLVQFKSEKLAKAAFSKLRSEVKTDNSGKEQKKLKFNTPDGLVDYFYVRKNV